MIEAVRWLVDNPPPDWTLPVIWLGVTFVLCGVAEAAARLFSKSKPNRRR